MVYIIILNWKNAPDTIACLNSLFHLEQVDYRIVVCDNQSPDGSYNDIRDWLNEQSVGYMMNRELVELTRNEAENYCIENGESGIYLVQTGANLGFAGGNNVGIRFALHQDDMDYVWLLNNDTEVEPDALVHLVQRCKTDPKIGICGSRLVYFYDRTHLQGMGGTYNRWLGTTHHYAAYASSDAIFDDDKVSNEIDYVIGASMLLTKSVLKKIGLLSEEYFLYFEELDYSLRAKTNKFKLSIASSSYVYHKEGGSIGRVKSDVADYYAVKNRLVISGKYFKKQYIAVYFSTIIIFFRRVFRCDFKKSTNVLKILIGEDM